MRGPMTFSRIRTIQDVVSWGLCIGCGACAYACSKEAVTLVNIESQGIRPRFDPAKCANCRECLVTCPGYQVDSGLMTGNVPSRTEADRELGPALEIWEGFAADPELRHQGSSGAILTALALYCLDREQMEFVLHTGMDEEQPWLNETVQSRSRSELLSRAGSRYAPASPCDSLDQIERSQGPCIFIGKPCDAAALAMARQVRPELDRKIGLALTFFCAGTPSTRGTLDLVESLGISPGEIDSLRYRGQGWPGSFKIQTQTNARELSLSYKKSWDRLTGYRPLRCHLCPDGLGRVADIACGDAWNRYEGDGNLGCSIILVRTRRGQEILRRAATAGYVVLTPLEAGEVFSAQQELLAKRRQVFGRLLGMWLLLVPIPRFKGFSLLRGWMRISLGMKLRTVLGTLRRILLRGQWKPRPLPEELDSSGMFRRSSAHDRHMR